MTDMKKLLEEKKTTHGEYSDHARCTQSILRSLQAEKNWPTLSDVQRETLHMIAHKMARIVTGNPDVEDHYIDISGYALLVSDRLASPVVPYPSEDFYSALARGWGVSRDEARERARAELHDEPAVLTAELADMLLDDARAATVARRAPGSPEDGGHHARDYVLGYGAQTVYVGDRVRVNGDAQRRSYTVVNVFPDHRTVELDREIKGYGAIVAADRVSVCGHAAQPKRLDSLESELAQHLDQGLAET